jgi:hypothetical protein
LHDRNKEAELPPAPWQLANLGKAGFHERMMTAMKRMMLAMAVVVFAAAVLKSQQKRPYGPRLYRVWSYAIGDTHLEEIDITTKGRVPIPGAVMNYSGNTPPAGSEKLHNTSNRQFAITVYGQIDVETSDGTKAHLRTGDMSFVEDITGKGHRTLEKGSQSVFVRVPESFDVKKWAAGQ